MNFKQLENMMAHVVSQLVGKSFSVPFNESSGIFNLTKMLSFQVDELTDILLDYLKSTPGRMSVPWVNVVYSKLDGRFCDVIQVAREHLFYLNENGGHYIPFCDERYPESLKSIKSPPLALSLLGDLSSLTKPRLSIVGSRKATPFALYETEKLATWLTDRNIAIVSGSAYGCDIAAHQGALNSGIKPIPTIVVFPGGLNRLEPVCNRQIFMALQESGAIFLSERLWWATILGRDYSARNRIISGLSYHLAVMQAEIMSGTMNTVRYALDQGREVLVLEHPDDDVRAEGSHKLIEDGAITFKNSEEFFHHLVPNA